MVIEPERWESMIFLPTHDPQSDFSPADTPMPVLWLAHHHFTPARDLLSARQLAGGSDLWIAPLTARSSVPDQGGASKDGLALADKRFLEQALNLHTCNPDYPILPSQTADVLDGPHPTILSWNVNILTGEQDHSRIHAISSLAADIICLSETKKTQGEISTAPSLTF
eukprot:4728338-Amphidinium_carterae.1